MDKNIDKRLQNIFRLISGFKNKEEIDSMVKCMREKKQENINRILIYDIRREKNRRETNWRHGILSWTIKSNKLQKI